MFLLLGVLNVKAQTISSTNVNNTHFCWGNTYTVTFATSGSFPSATFRAKLSNSSGSLTASDTLIVGTSTTNSITITIPTGTALSNNYKLIVNSSTSLITCDTLFNLTITRPSPSFTFIDNTCSGTNVSFTNTSVGNGVGLLNYSWNFSATPGAPSSPNTNANPTVSFNPANGSGSINYTVILTANDSFGCTNTTNNTVSIRQKPIPAFSIINNNACAGSNVSFTNTSIGVSPFTCSYNFGTLASGAPAINTNCNPTVQFNPVVGGDTVNYTTSLTVTDIYGCSSIVSNNFSVKRKPDARVFAGLVAGNFGNVPSGTNPDTIRKCNNISPYQLTLSNSSLTSSTNSNYTITWGDLSSNTVISSFSSTISHTYPNLGEYNLSVLVTNTNGCTTNKNIYIYVGTNPSIGLGNPGSTTGECISRIYTFPITNFLSNSPGTRYVITSNDGQQDTTFNHPPPSSYTKNYMFNSCGFTSLGNYKNSFDVRIRAVNACASSAATVEPIQLSSKPLANFNFNSPICRLNNVTFSNSSGNGRFVDPSPPNDCDTSSFPEWEIIPSTGWSLVLGVLTPAPFATNSVTLNFNTVGNYSVKLRIKGTSYILDPTFTCGIDSITKTICVQPTPVPNFTINQNPTNGCTNSLVNLNNTSNTLSSCGITQYKWFVYDSLNNILITPGINYIYQTGSNDSILNASINFLKAGKYKIRLQVTNSCGSFTKDTTITVKEKPLVVLPNSTIYCDSKTLTFGPSNPLHNPVFNSNYGIISNYNWTVTPSTGSTFVTGSSSSSNPSILFSNNTTSPITYTVTLTATNECGVSLPVTQQITINPKPIVTATSLPADTAFCSGGITNINLNSNLPAGVAYTWRAYRSSLNITGISNQLTPSLGPIVQTLGNSGNSIETVTYKIVGTHVATNCIGDSTTIVITVYPIPKVLATSQTICSGTATNIVLSSIVTPSLFTWTAATIGATTGFSNQTIAVAGPISQTLTNNSTTIDTVRYTIRAIANGCNSIDTLIKVAVKPIPQINNSTLTQSICSGDTARFTPNSTITGSTFNYTVSVTSGVASGQTNGTGSVLQRLFNTGLVNAIVRYSYTPSGGGTPNCIGSTVNFDVTVKPIPSASVNPTAAFLCSGAQTNIVLTPTIAGTLYTWTAVLTSGTGTTGFSNNTIPTAGPIAQTITNSSTANSVVTYTITSILNGCVGATFTSVITVYPGTTPGTVGNAATVCSGTNSGTLTLTGSTGSVVRWESSVSPFIIWNNVTNTLTTQNYLNLTQSTRYRAVVQSGTGGSCSQVATNAVLITVDSITVAGNLTGTDTVCTGINSGDITLNNRRGNIVNWQSSVNLSSWSNIGTTTVNPYTFSNLTQTTWYRVSVKNGVCPFVNSDSVRIQVDALPSAAVAPDKQVCATSLTTGVNDNLVANTITSGIGLWNYISGPNSPIPTITSPSTTTSAINNLAIGTHLIHWTVSNGKCPANKDTLYFTVYPPLVSTISSNQTICSGQIPSLLTGATPTGGNGTYTYQWQQSTDGVNWTDISGATLTSYQPIALTATTYYRKRVTAGNCVVPSNIVLINVLPALLNNTISPNATLCFGNPAPTIIGSTPTGGNGFYSYQWQKFNGSLWVNLTIADTLKDYNPNILSATTSYKRVITSGSCNGLQASNSNTVAITVNPLPIVNSGGDSSKCQNQLTYTLNGTPTGGTWSGTGVTSNTFNPAAMALGNYSLVYSFTNSNGCTNRDTAIISVIAPPIVNAGNDFSICENAPAIQLTGTTPISGGSWSGTAVTQGGLFNPTTAGVGVYKLYYSFTAGSGCGGLDSLFVTVNPKPSSNFTLPAQICPNSSAVLSTTTNSLATIAGYNWTVTNNGTFPNTILSSYNTANSTATFPENKTVNDTTYTIRLITTTNFGCIDTVIKTIILRKRPLAQFTTGSNINCGPALYTMVNGTGNVTSSYLWSTNPNTFVNINTPTSNSPQITFLVNSSNSALVYNIQLIATRNDGIASCKDTAIVPITVYPKPIVSFTSSPSDSGCSPLSVNFTNSSNPQNSESINTMSFLWNFGIYGTDTSKNTQRIFTNTGLIDSITNVKVIGTTIWGCKDSLTKIIKVYPFPKANFVSSIYSSCSPFLINNSVITLTQYPVANDLYTWQILNKNGTINSSSTGTTIPAYTLTNPNDTVYYRLITSHLRGCKADTLTRMFITIANPQASFSISDSVGCTPLAVNFNNTSTVGVTSTWTLSNGAIPANSNSFGIVFNNLSNTNDANYTARLIITAGSGCRDTIIKNITVYPKPKAIFILPNTVCADSFKTATNNSIFKSPSATYGWKFLINTNNTINDTTLATPTFIFINNQTGIDSIYTIRLRVTSINGCVHDTSKNITVYKRPLATFNVPNTNCGPANAIVSNTTLLNSTWLWNSSPSLSFTTNTSQNPNLFFPVNTTNSAIDYRINLTATRVGTTCTDTTSRITTIYPKPQALFTTATQDSCGPRLVNFTNTSNAKNGESLASMSYLWTYLSNNISTTNAAGTYTNTGVIDSTYNTRLIANSMHGCKDTANTIVTVRPNAKASFNYSIATSCAPFQITALNIITNVYPNANLNYTWYANNVAIGFTSTFPGYTLSSANDSVLIKLVATSLRGCKDDSLEVWFRTIANPVPNFTMSDSVGCTPLNVNFTNTSTVGVTSTWTLSNGAVPANTNTFGIVFNNLSNTNDANYTAKLVITAGSGCKDSITKNITVFPKPKANFNLATNTCSQSSLSPINNSIFKSSSANYGWKIVENTATLINDTNAANPLFTYINNQGNTDSIFNFRLRVTSIDGCTHDTVRPITIYRRPLANFTILPTFCGPANVAIANTTNITLSSWNWVSTPILNFNTATSQNPIVTFPLNNTNDSINYRLSLTATRNGTTCIDTISKIATIYPKPQALFTIATQDSCGPRLVNFTNTSNAKNGESLTSMSYLWTYLSNNISTTNAAGTYTNTGVIDSTYNTRLIATSVHGCKDTANNNVTVRPNAKASFNYTIATSCAPFQITSLNIITNVYTNANLNYTWYANNIPIGFTSTFPGYTLSNANDSVLIKLVTTSLRGCKDDSMQVMFRTIPNPVPNFTMSDSVGCTPLTVNFTNTSTVGVTSIWTLSNGAIPANTNPFSVVFNNLSNTNNVTYTAKLVITAGSGCKDSITKNITVYPKPKAIFSLPNNICADSFKTAINNSIYKTPIVTYGWKFITPTNNTINDTTLASPTFTFINNQNGVDSIYTIRLRVTSVDGCFHDTSKNVTIYKRPLAIFTVPTTYCGPTNITISNSTVLNSTWLWSSNPSLSFTTNTSQNPSLLFPQNSTNDSINYKILLTATRIGTTCSDTVSRTITIYPKPQALFSTLTKDSCGPRLVNFTNNSNAKNGESLASMSYLWTYLNNNISTTNATGTFTNSQTNDSIYNIQLIATSKHGCKDTLIDTTKVFPNAKASFTYSIATSCAPFSITSLNIITNVYPNANLNYKWYANNNLIGITSTFPGYTLSSANDSVLIKLVTVSKNGCKNDSMQVWFKTIPNPVPNFTMSDSVGCTPLTVNFTNTSTIGVVSVWTISNGTVPANTNPFGVVFNNLSNTNNANYSAKLVITAGSGCKDSITKNIAVYPKPKANFTLAPNACSQSSLSPSNNSIFKGSSASYGWKIAENTATLINDTNAANPLFTFINNQGNNDSIFNFRLRVTSIDGCIHDTVRPITIYRRPLANFTLPSTFCGPANIAITNSTNITLSSWSWASTPTLGFNTSSSQNPIVTFPLNNTNDSINYRLSLTATRNGTTCTDTISKIVTIYPKPQALFNTVTQDSCGPRLVNFTNTSNAKNGESLTSMSYLWTYLNNNISTTNAAGTYTNTGVIDSAYNTRLIATSMHGCKDTANTIVTVKPNAKAVFTSLLNLSCAPFNITATNIQAVNYSSANSTYQWFANNVLIGNGIIFPGYIISNQNDSVLIKLKTISLNNCKNDSMQVWFRTIPNPVPSFTAIDSIGCSPLLVNFNNTSSPNSGLSYRWELGSNANQSVLKFPNFTFYNYGIIDTTVLVKLVITAGGTGCSDSITKPIIIKPLPRPVINLSDSILCFPNTLNVTNLSNNIPALDLTGFKWKVVGPDLATIINDTSSSITSISFPDNKTGLNKFYQIRLKTRSNYGCIDSTQKVLRIPTRPIASFNFSADSGCAPVFISSNNTSLYALTFSWTSVKPNVVINNPGLFNSAFIFPSHKGTVDSIYPIQLITQTIAGCFDTLTKPFKVFPLPIANFTSDKDSGCSPLVVNFYNSTIVKKPSSFFWNYGDGNSQINNADTITKTFVGSIYQDTTYTVKLVTSSVDGCMDSTNKSINVKAGAYAKIKLTDTIICSNALNPTKLNIQNKSYGSVDTFYWDFGDGTQLISTVDSNINHPYLNEGLYTIVLKATNSCRTSFDTAKIEVQTPPNVNFTKSDSIGCSPLSVNFNNLSTNVYKASFLWTFGNGASSNLFTPPSINYLQSRTTDTTYYMNLSVSNVCGLFNKNDSIKVLPKPIAIFLISTDSGCSPLPVFMINQSVGLPISYKWYFGNGDSSLRFAPLQNPITYRTIDTISYFKIKLFATNTCGIDSTEKTVKVFPNTVKSFFTTSGNTGCEGLIVKFYDNSTGGNNISYNFGDGNTSLLQNPIHQYNAPGTYYAYQYVNNGCSFDTSFVIISVLPKPNFNISKAAPNICVKSPIQFNSSVIDSGAITWYFGDGDSSNAFNPVHIYNSAGKKYITVILKSFYNSCINIKYDSIIVSPIPVITLNADTNQACAYHLFKFNASSPQTNLFNWDFGDNNTGAGTSLTHLYQFGGTYTVKIVAQTLLGCIDSATKLITVFPVPKSDFSYTPKDTCTGPVNVNFTNLSVGATNYLWDFGNGNTSTNVNPTNIYSNVGSYLIKLISSNQFSCYDTSNSKYFVYQTPKANLDFKNGEGCPELEVQFENKSVFGTSYLWEFGDGETDTAYSPKHTYKLTGKYKVKLTAKAGSVCFDTITTSKFVTVFSKPTPVFTYVIQTNKKPYRTVIFSATTDSVSKFEWFYNGRLIGRGKNPTFRFDDADSGILEIVLKIVSIDGCDSSVMQTIELPSYWNGLYVPNAFTPTLGTGGANEFKPIGIELAYYSVKVFNKWGELMWESTALTSNGEPKFGWDGNDRNGVPCMQGSYIWVIDGEFTDGKAWQGMKLNDGILHKKGNVTLIR